MLEVLVKVGHCTSLHFVGAESGGVINRRVWDECCTFKIHLKLIFWCMFAVIFGNCSPFLQSKYLMREILKGQIEALRVTTVCFGTYIK